MWKFRLTNARDLDSLLSQLAAQAKDAASWTMFGRLCSPRCLEPDARGREMLARAGRGLMVRRQKELAELLYQGCLVGMMSLPVLVTRAAWKQLPANHWLHVSRRARRELQRGHAPGLVRDVLDGLRAQSNQFRADPVEICRVALQHDSHYGARVLLVLVLCMVHRYGEALRALDEFERLARSPTQRAEFLTNRGFVLTQANRFEEARQAFVEAVHLSPDAHFEINLLLAELMRGDEAQSIASAERLELKLRTADEGTSEQVIRSLAAQMQAPNWEASAQDIARVNRIKLKLHGIPALIADILSTIKIKPVSSRARPAAAAGELHGAGAGFAHHPEDVGLASREQTDRGEGVNSRGLERTLPEARHDDCLN